ncbi:MAG TPA: 4Fe-4S dicluster domain-containing protein [Candidatus Omnitrophota bacterium]|nr:4Fe-4S dicluster domain-containing protein [Candidatus Omnitrophota bacterium]HPD84535.1 4Fe-4S dicluster domain-containing protein [Candidatus Omnitrophota bacterium]HRZ03393.1 4Fe-4S dicluster domain-containing protein [Candidatus Omnitrophota bacterium]
METTPAGNKKLTLEDKLALVKTKKDSISHITVDETKCLKCQNKPCLTICPSKTYEEINGKIVVNYENCLECGTCRVACTDGAIDWQNPRGKFGVAFING